jgi:hypothetical protein
VTVLVDLGAGPVGQGVALVLAQNPEPPADKGEEFGKASPIGLVVILVLLIATVFLVRSMTKHIRRVPASFDPPAADTPPVAGPSSAAGEPSARADGVTTRTDGSATPEH